MTVPQDYTHAGEHFDALLTDLMAELDLTTRHQVYAVMHGVLTVFRRRLDAGEVLVFASGLPAMLRAMFVASWEPDEETQPFATLAGYDREARGVRRHHNLMPEGSLPTVVRAVRRHCDPAAFDLALSKLPPEARAFWDA